MDIIKYRLIEDLYNGRINKYLPETLEEVVEHLFDRLRSIRAERLIDRGAFVTTYNKFRDEFVMKRYCVEVTMPHTKYTIKLLNKGSIDTELFMQTINNIKRKIK